MKSRPPALFYSGPGLIGSAPKIDPLKDFDHVHHPPLCIVIQAVKLPEENLLRLVVIKRRLVVDQEVGRGVKYTRDVDQLLRGGLTFVAVFELPQVAVPVGNLIRLASEAESRNVSIL